MTHEQAPLASDVASLTDEFLTSSTNSASRPMSGASSGTRSSGCEPKSANGAIVTSRLRSAIFTRWASTHLIRRRANGTNPLGHPSPTRSRREGSGRVPQAKARVALEVVGQIGATPCGPGAVLSRGPLEEQLDQSVHVRFGPLGH